MLDHLIELLNTPLAEVPIGYTLGVLGMIAAAFMHWSHERTVRSENISLHNMLTQVVTVVNRHSSQLQRLEDHIMNEQAHPTHVVFPGDSEVDDG